MINLYIIGFFFVLVGFFLHKLFFIFGLGILFFQFFYFRRRRFNIAFNKGTNSIFSPIEVTHFLQIKDISRNIIQFSNSYYHHFGVYAPFRMEIESQSLIDQELFDELIFQKVKGISPKAILIHFSSDIFGNGKLIIQNNVASSLLKIFVRPGDRLSPGSLIGFSCLGTNFILLLNKIHIQESRSSFSLFSELLLD